jgi:uncharacterized protein YaeQ
MDWRSRSPRCHGLTSTIYNFEIELADTDRSVYETLNSCGSRSILRRRPSICGRGCSPTAWKYGPGLEFSRGISAGDEPAIWSRGATERIRSWIEIGTPDAARLHKAAKSAERVAVYTHKEAAALRQLVGKRIHRGDEISVFALDRGLIEALAGLLDRRLRLRLAVTGGQLYLDVAGKSLTGSVIEHRLS